MRHFITFRGIDSGNDLALDVSSICNSGDTEIHDSRCTTSGTSAAGSAAFIIGWTPDKVTDPYDGTLIDRPALYQTVVNAMLTAIETKAEMQVVLRDDTLKKVEFRGYIDPSDISLSRTRIPRNIAVSCKDHTTDLDRKIGYNIVRENLPVNQLVEELLELCYGNGSHVLVGKGTDGTGRIVGTGSDGGATLLGVKRVVSSLPPSATVGRFVVTSDESTTYRQAIDRLLLEKAYGYVLHYIHSTNKFEIVPCIPAETDDSQIRTINFMPQEQIVTRTGMYSHDGVLVKWPTVEERKDDNVYSEDIEISYTQDYGNIGRLVENGSYYPADGDVTETKQQYRRSDRDYVTGSSRIQNSDIDLLYAKDADLGIIAVPVRMTSRGTVADLDALEALAEPALGDYALVSDVDGEGHSGYRAFNGSEWEYTDTPSLSGGVGNAYTDMGSVPSKSSLPLSPSVGDFYLCEDSGLTWCWMDGEWQRKISLFCFPVLNTVHFNMEDGNPAFYPRSMWALGRNRSGGMVNLQALSVTATSVARTKVNRTTHPAVIKDPDEYEAQYIDSQSEAEDFALWLYNFRRIACTTCTWYEWEGQKNPMSVLGERVRVEYMTGSSAVFCVIQLDNMAVTRRSRKVRVTALLVSGFETSFAGSHETDTLSSEAVRIVDVKYYYGLSDSTLVRPDDDEWSEGQTNALGKVVWLKTVTYYSDGKVDVRYEAVQGYTIENEQLLSTSSVIFSAPVPAESAWRRGLYVWLRQKMTDTDGNVTYGTPVYSQSTTANLYNTCRFEITADSPTWDRNYADDRNATIAFRIVADGFLNDNAVLASLGAVTLTPYRNGSALTPVTIPAPVAVTFAYQFPRNTDWDSIVITAVNNNIVDQTVAWTSQSASATMSANDITRYDVAGGTFASDATHTAEENADAWFLANCGGSLDGYSFVDADEKVIKVRSQGYWGILSLNESARTGIILSQNEANLWDLYSQMTDEEKDSAFRTYGYKESLISRFIATAKLRMYGQGVIASKNVSMDTSEDIEAPGYLTKDGYRLEGENGVIRTKGMYADEGHFKNATIDDTSTLNGKVITKVFVTTFETETASQCLAQSPDASTGAADGVKGSEVKANLAAWANSQVGDSHQASAGTANVNAVTVSEVSLDGNSGATAVMRFSSVRSTDMSLKTQDTQDYDTEETISWPNPYPCDIVVKPAITANRVEFEYPVETGAWEVVDYGSVSDSPTPPTQTSRPLHPTDGDTWISYSNISGRTVPVSGGGKQMVYSYDWEEQEYTITTGYATGWRNGSTTFKLNGTTLFPIPSSVNVPAGGTISVTFSAPYLNPGEEATDGYTGSFVIKWKESDNFSAGVYFVKNASRSSGFYVHNLGDGIWTTDAVVKATVGGSANYVVKLRMAQAEAWTFQSSWGGTSCNIHKLFKFAWTSYASGLFTAFSARNHAEYTDMNGASESAVGTYKTIQSAELTSTSAKIGYGRYSASSSFTLNTSTYYRSFRIDFTPIARSEGVTSKEFTPMDDNTYKNGTGSYRWKEGHFVTMNANTYNNTSARSTKEDIRPYSSRALDILKRTDIVSFMYKDDHGNPDAYRHYGFIADDTAEELASPHHDRMDIGSCIGILIKGMQELASKIEELDNRT